MMMPHSTGTLTLTLTLTLTQDTGGSGVGGLIDNTAVVWY